jgi:cell division protein FtsB
MTREEEQHLQRLQTRVRQLILAFHKLEAQKADAEERLAKSVANEQQLRHDIEALQKDYDHLKTARILTVSGDDAREARTRISRLVREIDKCIALLNV